jgi:hypothetical protein
MNKTILIGFSALVLAITSVVKADISISGYQEFFAGSADQSTLNSLSNHGVDKAGMSNGNFSRLNANYSTTLDSGIEVAGSYTAHARDCQGNRDAICGVVNFNSVAFSGSFGTIGVGEKFDVGAGMLSRMTASGPVAEPDGGMIGHFYTGGAAAANNFGTANEFNYADNSMKITFNSNVYSGFSFAAGYTPNSATEGATDDAQVSTVTNSKYSSFSDILSTYVKYQTEMDGIKLEVTYGMQQGNAGRQGALVDYSDYEESAYSARIDYANFAMDYRKNEQGDSGQIKNNSAGNDEGTSICAQYIMANIGLGACQLETNFTDTSNFSNSSKTRTYSAEYNLGGGMKLGVVYFDAEQTANGATVTDADGIVSKLSVGF